MPLLTPAKGSGGGAGLDKREWNALIGIITAIVGNILISVALNVQRYAHIRLSKDKLQRQRQRSWRSRRRRKRRQVPGVPDYGTQEQLAEERALLNRKAPDMDEDDPEHQVTYHAEEVEVHDEDDEQTPLTGAHLTRSNSESTVRPVEKDSEDDVKRQSYLKSPYWWLGIILMTTGEAGNFIAYGFAPASIVSPLGVVALISNCIIAPLMLKESFRQRDFWGVLVAIGGAVTVVLSARMTDPTLGPGDIWDAISRWEFETYVGVTAAAIIMLMWASSKYGHKSVFIDLGLVGLFGGYTALSTKGVASLLTDTIWRAVTFPIFYLLVAVLVVTAIFQIRYVNRALQRFDSTRVVPTQFVCFTLSVIVGSAILYREFESTTAASVGKFVGGCIMTFLGVWLITSGKRDNSPLAEDEYDEETGEIEGIHLIDEEAQDGEASGNVTSTTPNKKSPVIYKHQEPSPGPDMSTPRASQIAEFAPPFSSQTASRNHSTASDASSGVSPFSDTRRPLPKTVQDVQNSASASNSEPVLPADARATWPTTAAQKRASVGLLSTNVTPAPASSANTPSRNSIARLLPGPISSPLSSSLSAIVADQLRRGVDVTSVPAKGSGKMSSLRKMRSNILDAETSPPAVEREGEPGPQEAQRLLQERKTRTRSVSDALGGLFKQDSASREAEDGEVDGRQEGK